MKEVKIRITLLVTVIVLIIFALFLVGINMYTTYNEENYQEGSGITRRTTTRVIGEINNGEIVTTSTIEKTTEIETTESTNTTTSKKNNNTNNNSNSNTNSNNYNKTTIAPTTTKSTTSQITTGASGGGSYEISGMPNYNFTITSSKSTNDAALDDWEWQIVNMINNERTKKGLAKLNVASELRDMAENAATMWLTESDEAVKNYLYGFNNYGKVIELLNQNTGYNNFYNSTLNSTKITSNSSLQYIGVGVIYVDKGRNNLPTHSYFVIYV